jgi:alpha-L-rhamnosidase
MPADADNQAWRRRRARFEWAPLKPQALPSLALAAAAWAALASPALGANRLFSDPDLVHEAWPADWITCDSAVARDPGVYHFRKRIAVADVPRRFVIHVSADNRFVLFVNGIRVGDGPARGDLDHWRYETFDISPMLRSGDNVLAATVWNYGALAPTAQMSDQTGFLVQGDTNAERSADTDSSWEAEREAGETFQAISGADLPNYYAASPGEVLDGARYDWEWQTSATAWKQAVTVGTGEPGRYPKATPVGTGSGVNRWLLVPDPLPPMEYSETAVGRVVRTEGIGALEGLPATVPAHTKASLLFDRGAMTTGYPELAVSQGKGATVKLTYAEALVDQRGRKGNRNEVAGRHILGLTDTVISDGGADRTWSPLWWRSWRYLQLDVQTGDEAITLQPLRARFSGYPFKERGAFEASDPSLARIWEVGTRTARMNAHETYMDCAYWEQLQYIGDTRIQALISYVEFGDDRLARQALEAYDDSRISEGLSQSRYPSALNQVIPTFSLLWIGMLHDFWMYRPDNGALAEWVPHTRSVIDWYARHQRSDGLLGRMPWWNFGDWTKDFVFGEPPQDADGGSALLSLYYVAALRDAADLEDYLGNGSIAQADRQRAAGMAKAVHDLCWDATRGLLADTPAHQHFSEQTNSLGVLLDVVPKEGSFQESVMRAVLSHHPAAPVPSGEFSPASVYFRFYVARALDHAGLSDLYVGSLGPWRSMLDIGLTTFAETAEPTRSDDHAWSAHPNYDLLTLVAGIRPGSAGFKTVIVEPHPSTLTEIRARMPHPAGEIVEHCRLENGTWSFDIDLPQGVTGTLFWGGKAVALAAGPNHLEIRR